MKYTIYINGQEMAMVISKDKKVAIREILHYFNQYLTEDFNEIKIVKE